VICAIARQLRAKASFVFPPARCRFG